MKSVIENPTIGYTLLRAVSPWVSARASAIFWRAAMKVRFKEVKKYGRIALDILYVLCK